MNEESKEMPQNTEVIAEQISPEVTQAPEVKAEVAPTPDKSITETKRSFWDKILGRKDKAAAVTVATGAAVAAGMAMAPSANAETQEKTTTSISQTTEANPEGKDDTETTQEYTGDNTEKDGEVIEVADPGYNLPKVDEGGIDELTEDGMEITNVETQKLPGNEDNNALLVDVDDANKLNNSEEENK